VLLADLDLGLSSTSATSYVQWLHLRTYDQRSSGPGDTAQGYNWFHEYLQALALADANNPSSSAVTWRSNAHRTCTFTNSGSYTFTANDRTLALLSHAHAGDPNDTYRLQFLDGGLMLFYDANHTPSVERLKLFRIEDVYGNQLTVTYDGNGRIDYIADPSGHYFRYSYLSAGVNSGKLAQIKAWKTSDPNDPNTLIAQLDFTYMVEEDAAFDDGCGSNGDLVKVVVSTHKTGETGTTFSESITTHYRYYRAGDSDGAAHQLKLILQPEHSQRASEDPNVGSNLLSATDAQLNPYATYQFKYDGSARCTEMTLAAGGSGCCGGGNSGEGTGTYTFSYATQTSTDRNSWAVRCTVQRQVDTTVLWTRYLDVNNWGEVWQDVLSADPNDANQPLWGHQYTRDPNTGQVTKYVTPGAITGYTASTHALSFNNDGAVYDYTYDPNAKLMASQRVRKYSEDPNDAKYLGHWEYTTLPEYTGYRGLRYALQRSYSYPSEQTSATGGNELYTEYAYVCHASTDRPMVVKATRPTVTTAQYGPNVAATEFSYYDTAGRLRWLKDAEGAVSYHSYNELAGTKTYSVSDVYTGTSEGSILPAGITSPDTESGANIWADWTGAAPKDPNANPAYDFQTTGSSSDYVQREAKSNVDLLGRTRWTADAAGVKTYYAYLDGETRTYPAWNAATSKPRLPVRRELTDKEGHTEHVVQVDPNSISFADPPAGAESLADQTKWVSWTKTTYDSNLRRATVRAYSSVPSSGDGSAGTNYAETAYTYGDDPNNRVTTVQVKGPEGDYSRTTTNAGGQKIKTEITATESGGSPTSWKTSSEYCYDQATPGSGSSQGGSGYLTQVKSYYGDSSSNSTAHTYDYRGRRLLTTPPAAPYTLAKYDNLDRVVATASYSSAPSASADPTVATTNRLGLGETAYNNRGQICESKRWSVNSDGTATSGNNLVTKTYYDRTGRTVAAWAPSSGPQVTKYNRAGDVVERQTCIDLGSTVYSSGAFDYSSDNPVIELTRYTLDGSGRTTETNSYRLEAAATTYINPDSIGSNVVQSKQRQYYDAAGRGTQSTNFGTFPSSGLASPMNYGTKASIASYDPNSPESRSDTQLVATQGYNTAGRLETVTDADGVVTRYEYDALGRRTAMVEDYDPNGTLLNRRTEYQYNGNGDLTKLIAKSVSGTDQQTQYVYGSTVSKRWVTEIDYPDPNTGQPSSAAADKVVFTYNHDGTVAARTDQNGSVLTYTYDSLRHKTHELLTTVGSGVDNAVLQVVTTYDSAGRMSKLTNRDNATADAGSVVNEVAFAYDGLGDLITDQQAHSGAKDPNSLAVQYAYSLSGSGSSNYNRLNYMTYPNGRTVYARYTLADTSSKQDEIAAAFSRVGQWTAADDPNKVYVEYGFAGLSTVIGRKHAASGKLGNDTFLNYDPNTANEYAGLDQFGRVVSQRITDAGNSVNRDDIQYAAARDGSPTFAEPEAALPLGRSQLYSYDHLHRLTEADTGRLNSGRTDLIDEWSDPQQIVYTMDILGNITTLNRKNSSTSASETRSYNATNELVSRTVAGEAARYWVNDDFADNDTTGWEVADKGTWTASSGKLSCTGTVSVTGAPDGGTGSILLIAGPRYQDVRLTCSATLSSGCDNGGLVFGYVDSQNYWVKVYSKAQNKVFIYQVSAGTWTQKSSASYTIMAGFPFTMAAEVRAGAADSYAATVPAGQVGVWCGDGTANSFDDFKVRDIAGPFEVDGKWQASRGEVRVDNSDNNVLEIYSTDGLEDVLVRRGLRGDKYVATFKFKWNATTSPGWLVRWLSPGDYLAIAVSSSDRKARLYKREADGVLSTLVTSASALTLTNGNWYEAKVVVDNDPNDANLQQLRFWVDANGNGYGDDSPLITTTAVDDVWSAGLVGLYRAASSSGALQQYDDVKIGYDNNGDGDIADAGDTIEVSDDFASSGMSLTYDNNGNLTSDGVLQYVYDGWNRLKKAQRQATHSGQADDVTALATYSYLPDNRRASKAVEHCGLEAVANDGGDTTVHFYYGGVPHASGGVTRWNVFETRNGSNQATRQWVWGSRYVDEVVFMDVNGSPGTNNTCDPDVADGSPTKDRRFFYHQDRNWNVVALTEYADGVGTNARVIERYAYTPYGEFVVLKGDTGSGELGNVRLTSLVGNVFLHQGLPLDHEKGSYQNRWREYDEQSQRFFQRDPLTQRPRSRNLSLQAIRTYCGSLTDCACPAGVNSMLPLLRQDLATGANSYAALLASPTMQVDPSGLCCPGRDCTGGTTPTLPTSGCTCQTDVGNTVAGTPGQCVCDYEGGEHGCEAGHQGVQSCTRQYRCVSNAHGQNIHWQYEVVLGTCGP
jgi:YD repeat-containing protein